MRFTTLGSGSSGNATLIEHGEHAVLVDCGLSARQLERRAAAIGFDLARLDALLITHEHADHVAGAAVLARRCGLPVYASRGTCLAADAILGGISDLRTLEPDVAVTLGSLSVLPVIVPHDAREPCQFVVSAGATRVGLLTDLGQATPHLERRYGALDGLVIEFNHDPGLLGASVYPRSVQQRIAGDYGHLSNAQAAALLGRLVHGGLRHVVAAHLSERTNTPERVWQLLGEVLPGHVERAIAPAGEALAWCDLGE